MVPVAFSKPIPQNRAMLAVPVDAADPLLLLSQVASSRKLFAGSVFRIAIQYGTLGSSATGVRSANISNGSV